MQLDMREALVAIYTPGGDTGVGSALQDGSVIDLVEKGIVTGFTLEDYAGIHLLPKVFLQKTFHASTVLYRGKFAVCFPYCNKDGVTVGFNLHLSADKTDTVWVSRDDFIPAICGEDMVDKPDSSL